MHKLSIDSDSVSKRFSISLVFNILRGVLTLTTSIVLARSLGPDDFGRMAFLLASFTAFKSVMDMYSSHAFFTFLSKETRSRNFVSIYWCWMAFQLIFSLILVSLLLPSSFVANIWHNENRLLVILALSATFFQQSAWQVACQMAEANRSTIAMQKLGFCIVLSHLLFILFLNYFDQLTLTIIFIGVTIEWGIGTYFAASMYQASGDKNDSLSSVLGEFWVYCKPLIPLAWLAFLYEFLDRWMLQLWGGSKEQAYYAVASNFMVIILLATTSVIRVFWKESAEDYHQGNMDKMYRLYQKTTRLLYFIGAFLAGSCIPWSSEILAIAVGDEYVDGNITFMLMLLFPVHQSLGHVSGVVLFATEKSKVQTILGSGFMIISMFVAYYVLAPSDAVIPGLSLGSEGLAWKMLVMQFIQVNVVGYVVARIFNWKYKWVYQFYILGGAIFIGYSSKFLMSLFIPSLYISFVLCFMFYFLIVALLLYMFPSQISGITKQELNGYLSKVAFIRS
tara:strand:+ start:3765 stop:5282 length:1518 start_codon:yes stop_codon:yes gene_type:complete